MPAESRNPKNVAAITPQPKYRRTITPSGTNNTTLRITCSVVQLISASRLPTWRAWARSWSKNAKGSFWKGMFPYWHTVSGWGSGRKTYAATATPYTLTAANPNSRRALTLPYRRDCTISAGTKITANNPSPLTMPTPACHVQPVTRGLCRTIPCVTPTRVIPRAPAGRPFSATGLALIAVFVGIIAALGLVPAIAIPGVAVPITLQTLGVMLAGSILGSWRGAAAVLVFLLLVALGLPLLAGGRGGLGVFFGPSAGFLIGFPVAAFVIGWLTERFNRSLSLPRGIAINVAGGIVVLYAFGVVGMSVIGQLPLAKAAAISVAFLPGDLAKAVVAALVARGVHQALPGLLPETRAQERRSPDTSSSRV